VLLPARGVERNADEHEHHDEHDDGDEGFHGLESSDVVEPAPWRCDAD
jgi:hypothetical protein